MRELEQLITATKKYNADHGLHGARVTHRQPHLLKRIWKKLPGNRLQRQLAASFLILAILVSILVPLWENPIPPTTIPDPEVHDYKQEKVAEGAYKLTGRDPIKQTLTSAKQKADLTLKENKAALALAKGKGQRAKGSQETYRWEVKLPSGTVFAFGRQQSEGIEPVVKVTNKDGLFVRYAYADQATDFVRPEVKGNIVSWEIAPGITARYTMQENGVKADYIVAEKKDLQGNKLDFVINHSPELSSAILPDGDMMWLQVDSTTTSKEQPGRESGKEIFRFPKPVIIDAKKNEWGGEYTLRESGKKSIDLSIMLPEEKLANAVFPLTIDPQVVDSSGPEGTATAYGNGRNIVRDAWGNLIAVFYGGSSQNFYYKNHNASTWTLGANLNLSSTYITSIDIDSAGDVHVLISSNNGLIWYRKVTVTRGGENAITNTAAGSTLTVDSATAAKRPSLFIANKGAGAGKEKLTVVWASNSASRGELRFLQCDVADDCSVAGNWKNASELETGSGTCADGTGGLPSSHTCTGAADPFFRYTTAQTTHHGVITQMPMKPKRTPAGAKWSDNGSFSDLANALDNNTGTAANISGFSNDSQDYLYIGDTKPFSKITVDVTATNSNIGGSLFIEYWNGSSWELTTNTIDNTSNGTSTFSEDGSYLFDEPSNWSTTSVDGDNMYWVRLSSMSAMDQSFDASVSVAEFYVNDRNSGALLVIGGSDAENLISAYVPWDDIADDKWENNPSASSNAWRQGVSGVAGNRIAANGSRWATMTNFPLSVAMDYTNNNVYVGLVICAGASCGNNWELSIQYAGMTKDLTATASWNSTGFPAVTETMDTSFTLTADQGDIYLFYVLDPDTTGLVYRRCSPSGGGLGNICDNSSDWGSEQTLVSFSERTNVPSHPQGVVNKAFGDTVAIDVLYTNNITVETVEYERHFVDMADRTTTVAASSDDAFHIDCDAGAASDDQFIGAGNRLGRHIDNLGTCGTGDKDMHVGFRFPNMQISQGAMVSSAYIDVRVKSRIGSGAIDFTVYGNDVDDAAAFTHYAGSCPGSGDDRCIGDRPRTTNSVVYSLDFATTTYRIDVTDIVQEIVCRGAADAQPCVGDFNSAGAWASGNDLALLLISQEGGSTNNSVTLAGIDNIELTTQVSDADAVGFTPSIAIGTDGYPVIAHYNTTDGDLMVTKCSTADCSSSSTTQISHADDVGLFTEVAIGTDGYPVIAYQNVTDTDVMVTKCSNASCTSNSTTQISDGAKGYDLSMAIGADGYPVISHGNFSTAKLAVTKCSNADCTGNSTTDITHTDLTGRFSSIAIGTDGYPIITHYNDTDDDLMITKCSNADCTSSSTIQITATDNIGVTSSIAIGTDGYPFISYYNSTDGDLFRVKCSDDSCSNRSSSQIVDADNVGSNSSVAIGADGNPVISYYNSTDGDLMVTKCSNDSCGSRSTTQLIHTDSVGEHTSLAIGADGYPVISYYNSTDGDLMVTKCSSDDCSDTTSMLDPTLQVNLGETGKKYSMGASTQLASGSASLAYADLDHPLSTSQVAAVDLDDTHYASVAATTNYASGSAQPAFLFKVNNTNDNNTYWMDAQAIVKSTLPTSTKPIHLQVYRGGSTDDWVTVATDNSTAADTDITLDPGQIQLDPDEYYFTESPGATCTSSSSDCWTYWRIYQEAPDTSQNAVLYVDYFDLDYVEPTPSKIVFTNASRTFQHSVCNGAASVFTIELQDVNDLPANPSQSTVVRISSNSTGETIYSDDTCETEVTNGDFTFTTAQNTKNVYIKDTVISDPTWTLSATRQSGDTLASDTQDYTVLGATKVVFTNPTRALDILACNGAANVFTMQLQDSTSTAITPTDTTVIRVTSNSNDYTIYSDDTCETEVTNGDFTYTTSDNTKSVYIIDRVKSTPTWTLTATKQSGPETITTGTQNYTTNAISTKIRGGTRIRGGSKLQ